MGSGGVSAWSASGPGPPPWAGDPPETCRCRSWRPASARPDRRPAGTSRSSVWEVLMNEVIDRAPIGCEAAAGAAPVPQGREHHDGRDRVRVVEGGGERDQLCNTIEADARLDLTAEGDCDGRDVRR